MIKKILYRSLWVLAILALLAFEIYALQKYGNTPCPKLNVELNNNLAIAQLTSAQELRTELLENHEPIEGQKIKNLNLQQIEKNISKISYVQDFNVFIDIGGSFSIKAQPRKAILRIYNQAGQQFYLGSDTVVMPLSTKHSVRVLLANGALPKVSMNYSNKNNIDTLRLPAIYKKIYILATKIQHDQFLNALIDQIYVKQDQEFELIPKTGVSYIEFGTLNNIDDKLRRLKLFYINGKEKINWTIYKSINLKYENQVVCTKN